VLERIGGVNIGPLHLLKSVRSLKSRTEVIAWSEARTRLHEELNAPSVTFTVIRTSHEITLPVVPKSAGFAFLAAMEFLPLLSGLFCYMIGAVVLHKKRLDEQSLVLFLLGSLYFLGAILYFASMSPELVMQPGFDYFVAAGNAAVLPITAVCVVHVFLLLPTRSIILKRAPRLLPAGYGLALLIGTSLEITWIIAMLVVCFFVSLLGLGEAFLTRKSPVERQQMKWILLGFIFGLTPFLGLSILPLVLTGKELVSATLTGHGLCLVFITIAFAIQKYRLMELDGLLEGTFVSIATLALLGVVDLGLMGNLGSRFAGALELRPTGMLFLSFVITLSLYAVIRDRMKVTLRKLLGREPLNERDTLLAFAEAASGHPPPSIVKIFVGCVRDAFHPKRMSLIEKGSCETEEILAAFKGLNAPVALWQSSLQEKILKGEPFYLALPLTRAKETDYVVLLGELPGGRLYSSQDLSLLRSLLHEANLLYENAWFYDENLKNCRFILEEERRHLNEKERIIRDLHDGLGSITTNVHVLSEIARKSESVGTMQESLSTISELSREGLAEIRAFMHSLDHENLSWPELGSEFRVFGSRILEPNGIAFEIECTMENGCERPGSLVFLNLCRIYREALTNVVKHSGAARVSVRLTVNPTLVVLEVKDDGVGFGAQCARKGRGLAHMAKRAEDIGGALSIRSGQGTEVRLDVKVKN
jgi:signal transduction histidine kinase